MTESPGERELADALRGVIGDEAARAVAASVAELRPGSARWFLYRSLAAIDVPQERRRAAERCSHHKRISAAAEGLAALLVDRGVLRELATQKQANENASGRKTGLDIAFHDRAVGELEGLKERLRELAQLAEGCATVPRPRVRPGPMPDAFRRNLVRTTALRLRLSGVRIGTGERSPAVLALEAVLRWYPLPGDARQLLRDLKGSKDWAHLMGKGGSDAGG
jgi:hypothetical protein